MKASLKKRHLLCHRARPRFDVPEEYACARPLPASSPLAFFERSLRLAASARKLLVSILAMWTVCSVAGTEVLPAGKIAGLQKRPCTFIHVWADWCGICMQELPGLVATLGRIKQVNPVIIDISSPFVQESFSKRFIASIAPSFNTYTKPAGKNEDYMFAVDKSWNNALPYSALYHNGKKRKVWMGPPGIDSLPTEIAALCK